jgi:hypothetical protein
LKPKHASKEVLELVGAISLNVQYILYALEENAIHQHSKLADPSMAPNPHPFGIPRRHHRQEEETPHLHTGDNKSKA